jgi:hypothetical protein
MQIARSSGTKSTKKKTTARQNAQNRAQRTSKLAEAPRPGGGNQRVSQGRFANETPLTGEDRPTRRDGGGKQYGFRQDNEPGQGRPRERDRNTTFRAPPVKRRTKRERPAGEPNEIR